MLAVLCRIAERREALPLEIGNCFGIGLEIDHLARDQRDHPAFDEDTGAAEHAAHVDGTEFGK